MPRLTKRLVDAATVNSLGTETFLSDADVKGFGVRVKPSGVKSFVLKYRADSRRSRDRNWTAQVDRGRGKTRHMAAQAEIRRENLLG